MKQIEFKFRKDTFSKIFPFYILLDTNLCIKSYGKSISKIIPELKKTLFKDNFSISRPHITQMKLFLEVNLKLLTKVIFLLDLHGLFL